MLLLIFYVKQERYAIDASKVHELMPLVKLNKIPNAPDYVAGAFNFAGNPTPVLDLNYFTCGVTSQRLLSSRIILIKYPDKDGTERLIGLLAERVTQTMKCSEDQFKNLGIQFDTLPFLGNIATDEDGMIQFVNLDKLMSDSIRDLLYAQPQTEINTATTHGASVDISIA